MWLLILTVHLVRDKKHLIALRISKYCAIQYNDLMQGTVSCGSRGDFSVVSHSTGFPTPRGGARGVWHKVCLE